jgi:hypothetical protein
MIADDRDHPIERAVKLATMPIWGPVYLTGVGAVKVWKALPRRTPKPEHVEVLQPWMPTREFERAVFAALILAGEPINNRRLAELMDCSPGEASRGRPTRRGDPQSPQGPRGSHIAALNLKPRRSELPGLFFCDQERECG